MSKWSRNDISCLFHMAFVNTNCRNIYMWSLGSCLFHEPNDDLAQGYVQPNENTTEQGTKMWQKQWFQARTCIIYENCEYFKLRRSSITQLSCKKQMKIIFNLPRQKKKMPNKRVLSRSRNINGGLKSTASEVETNDNNRQIGKGWLPRTSNTTLKTYARCEDTLRQVQAKVIKI